MGEWRGNGKPGRPPKGQETKERFRSVVAVDAYRDADTILHEAGIDLFNAADPSVPILKEKFEHRAIAYMRASGMTRKEIFIRLGGEYQNGKPVSGSGQYSYVHLGNIMQQPWFRQRVLELQHEAGYNGVEAAIRNELPTAVETVVEIMNDEKASHTARLNAAAQILDRGMGKAVQKVESTNKHAHMHIHENAEATLRELKTVEQELKQLGASVG